MHGYIRVLKSNAHPRQVFLRQPDHGLIDVAQHSRFDGRVFDHFTENAAVATPDDEHTLWVRVGVEGEVGDHFLVAARFQKVFVSRLKRVL